MSRRRGYRAPKIRLVLWVLTALALVASTVSALTWATARSAKAATSAATPGHLLSLSGSKADVASPVVKSVEGAGPNSTAAMGTPKGFNAATSQVVARDAQTTTFKNADGTQTLASSSQPVNFKDAGGVWHAIDNSIVADPDRAGGLTNAANGWRVHFGTSSQGVSVDTAQGSLSLRPLGGAAGVAPVVVAGTDTVRYANVWPGADVEYTVTGESVKEVVLIQSRTAATSYAFEVRSGTKQDVLAGTAALVSLSKDKDGDLAPAGALGSTVRLAPPVVVDSQGTPLSDAGAVLTPSPGQAVLSVNPGWVAAQPDSAFPIRVDPTIITGMTAWWGYESTGYTCSNCSGGVYFGNSRASGDTYWRTTSSFPVAAMDGGEVLNAYVTMSLSGGTANADPAAIYAPTGPSYAGNIGGGLLATGNPAGGVAYTGSALVSFEQTEASANYTTTGLAFTGSEIAGLYTFQEGYPTLYITFDHAPSAAAQAGALPGNTAVVATTTPSLTVPAASDPDGDAVYYDFTISGGSDTPAGRASSGWITTPSWSVPAGVLGDGQTYSWSVATGDQSNPPVMTTGATWSNQLTVNQRLGDSSVSATDSLGGVEVDLASGNADVAVAPHKVATVGGGLGVGLTYNSQASQRNGLLGQYYSDTDGVFWPPTAGSPVLVRTDPSLNMIWNQAGYPTPPGVPSSSVLVRWTGYITLPAAGSYQLGVAGSTGAKIFWGGDYTSGSQIYAHWGATSTPGWSTTVTVTGSSPTPVPVEVQLFQSTGPAQMTLYVQGVSGTSLAAQLVPSTWLTPGVSTLPAGWSLSLPGGGAGYSHAEIGSAGVVLTDGDGGAHSYLAKGGGGYSPPAGETGVLTRDASGNLELLDSDGSRYSFNPQGSVVSAISATDSKKPASAVYHYNASVSPPQVSSITDPVSGQSINLYYGSDSHCSVPGGYSPAPSTMLCQVAYWDGAVTNLDYNAGGQLAAVVDPGSEQTVFGYGNGLLTKVVNPLINDWVNAGNGFTSVDETDIAYTFVNPAAAGTTNIRPPFVAASGPPYPAGSIPMAVKVTAAAPDGATAARPEHDYTYVSTNETQVHVVGLTTTVDTDVTYDASGRTLTTTTATGQTSTTTWDGGGQDLPVASSDAAGRVTTTIYDWALRATDTYGPATSSAPGAAGSCFQATGVPVASTSTSCGTIPHKHTAFDTDTSGTPLTGLGATTWDNPNEAAVSSGGTPAQLQYSTGTPTGVLTGAPATAGSSTQYTGDTTTSSGSSYLSASVGDVANDGVRVFVDNQPALDRWTTLRQAIIGDGAADYWRLGESSGSTTATNQISPSLVNGSLTLGFDGSVSLQVMEYVFDGPVAFTDDVEGDLNGVERIRS